MPDLRGHGSSVPGTPAYPRDALVEDLLTLIARLELCEYDLGGYSLGASDSRARPHHRRDTAACVHRQHKA
jgi:pimeloyl-ACP methyl ester carboxylesterase